MVDKITIRRLGPEDASVLTRVAEGVFDDKVKPGQVKRFLAAGSHEILVALSGDLVVGMITGVVHLHPDKNPQFWINEIGVGGDWQRRGIGTRMLRDMLGLADRLGCDYAWLATEADNTAARGLYRKCGGAETEGLVVFDWDDS
jgi:ribosomal protein S18 acetylase RimI-like enzyme